jgi:hypothetical protein
MRMNIKSVISLALLFASITLTGCCTMADAVQARGTGVKVTYHAPFDDVWGALPDAITSAALVYSPYAKGKIMSVEGYRHGEVVLCP